jgi:hypothetical protein
LIRPIEQLFGRGNLPIRSDNELFRSNNSLIGPDNLLIRPIEQLFGHDNLLIRSDDDFFRSGNGLIGATGLLKRPEGRLNRLSKFPLVKYLPV